jgi:hypothetical protein
VVAPTRVAVNEKIAAAVPADVTEGDGLEGFALDGGPHHILCCDDPFGPGRAIETGLVERLDPGQQRVGNLNCGVRIRQHAPLGLVDHNGLATEIVAKKIIELAQQEECDPIRLRDRAVQSLSE